MKKLLFFISLITFLATTSGFTQKTEASAGLNKTCPVIYFTVQQSPTPTGGEVVLNLFWQSHNNAKKTIVLETNMGEFIVIDASKSGSTVIARPFGNFAEITIDGYGPNGGNCYHRYLSFYFDSFFTL